MKTGNLVTSPDSKFIHPDLHIYTYIIILSDFIMFVMTVE